MIPEQVVARWEEVLREFQARCERLVTELQQSWTDVRGVLDGAAEALEDSPPQEDLSDSIRPLEQLFSDEAERRYVRFENVLERRRPLQRILQLITSFDSSAADLLGSLPVVAELDPESVFRMGGLSHVSFWTRLRQSRAHPKSRVLVRESARSGLHRAGLMMSKPEGDLLVASAEGMLLAVAAWQLWRNALLSRILLGNSAQPDLSAAMLSWREQYRKLLHNGDLAARSLSARVSEASTVLRGCILSAPLAAPKLKSLDAKRQSHLQYWARLQRAVFGQVELEHKSLRMARETLRESNSLVEAMVGEHDDLVAELDGVLNSLRKWSADPSASAFPPPQAQLVSAEERVNEWSRALAQQAKYELPATIELILPRFALPSRRVQRRLVEPQFIFITTVNDYGRDLILNSLREAESNHKAVVREIERAREVFAFARETGASEDEDAPQIALEAVDNANELLEYQRRTIRDFNGEIGQGVEKAIARLLLEYHHGLDSHTLRVLVKAGRHRGGRLADFVLDSFHDGVQWAAKSTEKLLLTARRAILRHLGLTPPPRAIRAPIEQIPALGSILSIDTAERELPAIYRRLFRLAPVEDPRFLIGRREEMAGIADAVARWMQGEATSVMVVGARGSGKSSLLNCAVQRFPASVETVRGQFIERIRTADELDLAMRRILSVPPEDDLLYFLQQKRRIIVIEEFERTFIRAINGFNSVRSLVDLVQQTAEHTLWVISMNESSHRLLNAACGINQFFSHRINAMSVSREAMVAAIMQRHNLSGLRLQFAPVPLSDPRVSRVKSFFGLAPESQQLFFDSLYEQSEGIYRSAFELWQDCIERVEAGTIHMAQPLAPGFDPLESELNAEDCFALQAIVQHGSLDPEELAGVLRISTAAARRRTNRLLQLEILETEPAGSGYRVRPQAGRFVRDALNRRNIA